LSNISLAILSLKKKWGENVTANRDGAAMCSRILKRNRKRRGEYKIEYREIYGARGNDDER